MTIIPACPKCRVALDRQKTLTSDVCVCPRCAFELPFKAVEADAKKEAERLFQKEAKKIEDQLRRMTRR